MVCSKQRSLASRLDWEHEYARDAKALRAFFTRGLKYDVLDR